MTTLLNLANRFRTFTFDKAEPDTLIVYYRNDNSRGNRYVRWKGVWAKRFADNGDTVIDKERLYKEIASGSCDWRLLFEGVNYGLITGPKTLAAIDECLEILRNDLPPEDDGKKVRHVNHLGGSNMVSKPTFHSWNLTTKLGKIIAEAFFADRTDRTLYSEDFVYTYKSHSGWSRSC